MLEASRADRTFTEFAFVAFKLLAQAGDLLSEFGDVLLNIRGGPPHEGQFVVSVGGGCLSRADGSQ